MLVIVGTVVLVRTGRGRLAALAGASVGVYLAVALFTMNETISLRYLLPAVPFLAILAAGALAAPGRLVRRDGRDAGGAVVRDRGGVDRPRRLASD